MSVLELIRLALWRLGSSRLRAALTMLGVIIGVASVVALVSVGQGTTSTITSRLSSLGTNLLTVNPGAQLTGNTFGAAGSSNSLTLDDADAIRGLADVAGVAPELSTQQLVVAGDSNTTTQVVGATADYLTVRAHSVWQGSFISEVMVDQRLSAAVLGATTAQNLALGADAIGTTVSIGGLPFQVIGILQAKGGAGALNPDDQVIVPISIVQKYFVGGNAVRTIGVSVASPTRMDTVKAEITALLREDHELAADASDDFTIFDQAQLLETASSITATLTILLGGIASISLVVGGIGIMNIMLVSVRERTREIGIRKAIGARARDILSQFLIEAMTLSLLGGAIGVLVGLAVSALIARIAGWPFTLDPTTLVVATAFSAGVGIVFGVWPARQAAVLDPITALRYE
jgi:putative ABC transport system permease protein